MLLTHVPVWASMPVFFAGHRADVVDDDRKQGHASHGQPRRRHLCRARRRRSPPLTSSASSCAFRSTMPCWCRSPRRITGEDRFTQLQRIGAGLALLSICRHGTYIRVESRQGDWRPATLDEHHVAGAVLRFVLGAAEVFASIGMLGSSTTSPQGPKSLGAALAQLAIAGGSYLQLLPCFDAVASIGYGFRIPDDLDQGHLNYFYWFMAALSALSLLQFVYCSTRLQKIKIITFLTTQYVPPNCHSGFTGFKYKSLFDFRNYDTDVCRHIF
ncbi:hypothetical protein ZWY2020_001333 [Hordeum vulgare]|nr:hypothetical protein ZWY2020_001333 [Hordeum vulgare]